jgi:CRISPR-associated protein Csb1
MEEVEKLKELNLADLVKPEGPVCLVSSQVGKSGVWTGAAGPEIGHVIYKSPQPEGGVEDVCIVDSAASMANHLEAVCFDCPNSTELHPDLAGMPYVVCVTDRDYNIGDPLNEGAERNRRVCTSLTEGHSIASDYFLEGLVTQTWVIVAKKKKGNGDKGEGGKSCRPLGGQNISKETASRIWHYRNTELEEEKGEKEPNR